MARIKVHELRNKSKIISWVSSRISRRSSLFSESPRSLVEHPTKVSKIKVVRLGITQVLTVTSQKQKAALREVSKNKKLLPLDLRTKKTRAIRRRLTKHQASLKTEREKKRELYHPLRKYAIKA